MKINFDIGQRDSGHVVVSSAARQPDTELAISRRMKWNEAMGKPTEVEAYANQRLNLSKLGRPMEERPRFRTVPGKSGCTGL
jgi:hypothetical protein